MWNNNCAVKGCTRLATYSEPTKPAEFCKSHATQGTIEQNYICCTIANCRNLALFGDHNAPTHCDQHKADTDIYYVLRHCANCSALFQKQPKSETQCQDCQDNLAKTIDEFVQDKLPHSIKGSGKLITYQYTPPQANTLENVPTIIIEFSKNATKQDKGDNSQYATLQQVLKKPIIVVRINMGKFKSGKSKQPPPSHADRLNILYHFLQQAVAPVSMPLLIKHMFYDGFAIDTPKE